MLTWNSVITAAIFQIVYLNQIKPAGDLTFEIWPVTICTQVMQCLSILTTCLVYLEPNIDCLANLIHNDDVIQQSLQRFGRWPEASKSSPSFRGLISKISRAQLRDEGTELEDIPGGLQILRTTEFTAEESYTSNVPLPSPPPAPFFGLRYTSSR